MRHFHICCDGSFGNRLSGLIGGLTLARLAGLQPKVSWPSTNMCRALFPDIFAQPPFEVEHHRLSHYYDLADNYDFLSVNDQHMGFFGKSATDPGGMNVNSFRQWINEREKDVFYYTPLMYDWIPDAEVDKTIKQINYNQQIMVKLATFLKQNNLDGGYYGVHIRMTDFVNIESFDVDKWIHICRKNPDKKFFICSDDPETEARFDEVENACYLKKEFKTEKYIAEGDWHHAYTDGDGRHSVFNVERGREHVLEAVVDFLLLSMSEAFKTGEKSTFLNMARRIGEAYK